MTSNQSNEIVFEGCEDCNQKGILDCDNPSRNTINSLKRVNMEVYLLNPTRFELRKGSSEGAPKCPYGNNYQWIGFDLVEKEYVRFTKSVFKLLIQNL